MALTSLIAQTNTNTSTVQHKQKSYVSRFDSRKNAVTLVLGNYGGRGGIRIV